MLRVGEPAPDFSLIDHQGRTQSLKDYQGKQLVIWFYPKADTPGCTAEGCSFRDLASEFKAKKAAILGVSFDDEKANGGLRQKIRLQLPVVVRHPTQDGHRLRRLRGRKRGDCQAHRRGHRPQRA